MENHEQVDYTVRNTKYVMFQVQPVQHVYPPQVQYVEGGDAVYTNGALYVIFPPLGRVLPDNLRPHLEPSFMTLPPLSIWGCVCTNPSPLSLGGMLEPLLWNWVITALRRFQKSHTFVVFASRKGSLKEAKASPNPVLGLKIQPLQSRNHFCPCFIPLAFRSLWRFVALL